VAVRITRQDAIVLGTLAVVAIVLPMAFGALLGWPDWLSILVAAGMLGLLALAAQWVRRWRHQRLLRVQYQSQLAAAPDQPDRPDEQAPHTERRSAIAGARLPSAEPGYPFVFAATVCWNPAPGQAGIRHTNPEALAVDAILDRAIAITTPHAPADHVVVAHRLAATLGSVLADRSGQVVAWAQSVTLTLPEGDEQRLHLISELRKQEQVWEHERTFERSVRTYLTDEVLVNPGTAVVWWLSRHLDQVEETARLIGPLTELTAAANNTTPPRSLANGTPEPLDTNDSPPADRPHRTAEPG
jgi:hypothetical protein